MKLRWNYVVALLLVLAAFLKPWNWDIPTPDPTPEPGPMQIAVVCESASQTTMTADQLAILNSLTFRERLTARGHTFRNIDPNVIAGKDGKPPAEWKWALDIAQPLPSICLRKGDKAKRIDLPAHPDAAFDAIVKEGG